MMSILLVQETSSLKKTDYCFALKGQLLQLDISWPSRKKLLVQMKQLCYLIAQLVLNTQCPLQQKA
jgi:hypothetical protein